MGTVSGCQQAASRFGLEWQGRNYDPNNWGSADPLNRALSAGNACLHGTRPGEVPWDVLGADIVIEATGQFRTRRVLERHLEEMVHCHGDDPGRVLVIGDAIDDAVAAQHLGARAVLLASGSHPRDELEATGVPVVDTLVAALELGGVA